MYALVPRSSFDVGLCRMHGHLCPHLYRFPSSILQVKRHTVELATRSHYALRLQACQWRSAQGFYCQLLIAIMSCVNESSMFHLLLSQPLYSHTTSENIATCRLRQFLMARSSTSNTSHCLALKKVAGPVGGPSSGGTTILRLPPIFMPLMPSSKPAQEVGVTASVTLLSPANGKWLAERGNMAGICDYLP